jgi:hypothetical protein
MPKEEGGPAVEDRDEDLDRNGDGWHVRRARPRAGRRLGAAIVLALAAALSLPSALLGQGAGTEAQTPNPAGVDFFNLTLGQTRALSRARNFEVVSVDDNYDPKTGTFICSGTVQSSHLPWFDHRSAGLVYQAWYDQGVHAWDISNPYLPREVGYYFSPRYPCVGPCGGGYPGAKN